MKQQITRKARYLGLKLTVVLIFVMLMCGQGWGQTAGTLSFTLNPVAHTIASYQPKHLAAAWIESASGTFIKTRDRLSSSGNASSHLLSWKAASVQSVTDANAGATLANYTAPVTITPWTGNDLTGTTPYYLVPDGDYKVWFEFAWDDPAGPATEDYISVQFTKGPNPVTITPANVTNFTGISLIWTPSFTNTITTSAVAPTTYAAGAAVSVPFTIGGGTVYNNNLWTAQLSDASGSFASPVTIGSLTSATAGTVSTTLPAGTPSGTGYRIRVVGSQPSTIGSNNGANITVTNGISPTLTATVGATVDNPFVVTFTDDPAWRAAVTGIKIGGVALTSGYAIGAGTITFTPSASLPISLLQSSGLKNIVVSAAAYGDASVNQQLDAGVSSKLGIKTQPISPLINGAVFATQPAIYIQDQYGNTTTSTATVTAAVGTGTWTLGGTTLSTAIVGTATYTDLTATTAILGGSTILFTSPGLTSVSSNTFFIPFPLTGTFNVGTGGDFTSFTRPDGLFSVINASGLSGNVTINVISDITTENGAVALNQWTETGVGGYTLTVQPSGGVTRTLSGTIAGPLFNFNGADRVTINGLNTGGNALFISNLSTAATAGTSTIQFINDATNNTITNCSILGSTTASTSVNGGNVLFNTGTVTGNDNNTISYCKIGPAGTNLPSKGVCANGSTTSAAIANSTISITNCEIYDFFLTGGCAGIYALTGNTDWSITNNKIYQTATRTFTAAGTMSGIYFVNSTYGDNVQITGNTIGYASNAGTGTFTLTGSSIAGVFQAIYMQTMSTSAVACTINNNIISDISFTSSSGAFTGIYNNSSASSNTININGNQIKNIALLTTTGTAQAIYTGSATTLNCNSNTIDGITRNAAGTYYIIRYNAPTAITLNGNIIRNIASNITSSTSAFYAVYCSGSVTTENFIGNTIYNLTSTATGAMNIIGWYSSSSNGTKTIQNNKFYNFTVGVGSGVLYGIRYASGSTIEVSGNQIYTFSGGITQYGINVGGGTTNNVFKNKIYDMSNLNAAPVIYGIYVSAGTTNNIYNNFVGDLRGTAANAVNPLVGIYLNSGTTNNVYYNTVYLNATSSGAAFGSSAIYASITPTVNLRNNILVNTSTPMGATGYTCAYRRSAGAAGNLSTYAATSNNNLFYAGTPSTNNLIYYDGTSSAQTLAAYKAGVFTAGTIAPRDANSITENPLWVSTTGSSATYLHINTTTATQIESGATTLAGITDDFDGDIRNVSTPDVGADEFNGVGVDLSPPVISYTNLGNQVASATVVLTATITDLSGVPTTGSGLPVLYYKVNSGTYASATGVSIGSNQYTFTFSPTTLVGDIVSYYVVAQDLAAAKNTVASPSIGANGYTQDPPSCSTAPTTPNTFLVAGTYTGTYNVGTTETYTSLTNAGGFFAAINAGVLTGNVTIIITSDLTETGLNALNQWAEAGGSGYTLTIKPSGGVARTISGTADGIPMINFNGADRVTFDGLNTGGNSLTISNLSVAVTANTSTIQFINDATNNTITNCTILGSSLTPLATVGGNIVIATGATSGNDNITISNSKIGPAGVNLPSKGVFSSGSTISAAIANSNVTVTNCEIYDFFLTAGCAGVYATTGNTDWNITNNKVYQTATRTFTATGTMTGIYFVNATYGDNLQITGNTIGYASNAGTGVFTLTGSTIAGAFQGIYVQPMSTAAVACNINNNIITDISLTSSTGAFTGIYNNSSASSNTININNNQVKNIALITTTGTAQAIYTGSATTLNCNLNTIDGITRNGAGTLYGIQYNAPTSITFNGNTITDLYYTSTSGTSAFYGLYGSGSATNETLIGNNVYNLISSSTGTQTIIGWYNNTGTGTKTVQNNKFYNISAAGGATIYGFRLRYGATVEVSGNSVYTISGAATTYGMYIYPPATVDNIFKNKIYDLSSTSTSAIVYGLYIAAGTTNNIYNNIIGDLRATASNTANAINGIYLSAGTNNNVYYNTVYLNTSSSGAAFGSTALYTSTTPVLDLRNNIFVNNSTPNGATSYTCAIRRSDATLTNYAATSNNNLFYAGTPGTNNLIMHDGTTSFQTLASYQALVATRDAASITENPYWTSTVSSDANFLHVNVYIPTAISNGATNIAGITDDFDGNTRQGNAGYTGTGIAPDMGAVEFDVAVGCTGMPAASTIVGATSLCAGSGTTLSLSTTYTDPGIIYQWEKASVITGPYTNMGIAITQATGNLAVTTYYICIITCGSSGLSDTTNVATVSISPTSVGGTVSPATATVCSGTGTTLTLSGNTGNIQWQSSLDNSTWANINGETSATLATGNLNAMTYYRAIVTSGVCSSATSSVATVNVDAIPVAGTVTGGTTICSESTSGLLTLGGYTGTIVRWESSTDGNTWAPIVNILSTYTSNALTSTTQFRAVIQNGVCNNVNSVATTVNVDSTTYAGEVTGGTTVCYGTTSGLLTLGSHTGSVVRWESSEDGNIWTPITNTNATYTSAPLTTTTMFRAVVQNGVCTIENSIETTVSIDPATVAGAVTGGTTICNGSSSDILTLGAHTGTILRWESSEDGNIWTPIASTLATYTSGALTTTTQFRAVVQSGVCGAANSTATTVTVDPTTIAGAVTGGTTICAGTTSGLLTLGTHTGNVIGWESSIDGTNWNPISNTLTTYISGTLIATTQFRAVVQSGVCNVEYSSPTTVTVDAVTVAGAVTGGTTVCTGNISSLLTLGTYTGTIVRWESSTDGNIWSPISNTSSNYTSGILSATTQFRAVVQNGVCNIANSLATTVNVTPSVSVSFLSPTATRCQGPGVSINTATATNSTGLVYSLDGASVSAGNTVNPNTGVVSYAANWSGTTTIIATASGCNGPAIATQVVTITPSVTISAYSPASSTRCQGAGTATITTNATNSTGITYSLDAASTTGGNTINALTGVVTYASSWSGSSIITASAAGCNGPALTNHTVTIAPSVSIVPFTPATSIRCQGSGSVTTTTSATNSTGITYSLDASSLAGGNTINAATGAVNYNASWSGSTTIIASAAGCNGPAIATHVVTVTPSVTINAFSQSIVTRCQGVGTHTATTSANNSTGITYSLDGASIAGGNTIVAASGQVTFAANWNGTTTITASAAGCNGPATTTYTVTTTPTVSITAFSPATSTRCQGTANVTYNTTASNSTGLAYSLDALSIAGGNTINAATGIVTYAANWNGTTTITAIASGCNGPATTTHVVTTTPLVAITPFSPTTSTRCQGAGMIAYTTNATNATGITYTLDALSLAGGNTINALTGEVTFDATWNGTSTITATATGCNGTVVTSCTVTTLAPVSITPFSSPTVTNCQAIGTYATTTTATNSTGITYSLDAPSIAGGNTINPTTGALTFAPTWAGTTTNTASAAGCNGPATTTQVITITPLPGAAGSITSVGNDSVSINENNVLYSVATIANATSYIWTYYSGGSNVDVETATNSLTLNFYASATSGNLTVKGHNACGEGVVSNNYPIWVSPVGVDEIESNVTYQIYPNPTNGVVTISINGINDDLDLQIINLQGKIIRASKLTNDTPSFTQDIDLSKYAKGIYYIKLTNKNFTKVEKLVVQ